jgi:hypothetical protein
VEQEYHSPGWITEYEIDFKGCIVKSRLLISSIIVILIAIQTACNPSGKTETVEAELDSSPTLQPSPTSKTPTAPTSTPTSTEEYSIPERPLVEEEPWLLVQDVNGVWALNSDGSGLAKIIDWTENPERIDSVRFIPAAGKAVMALLEYDSSLFSFPTLSLISLPDGQVQYSTHLLSNAIEQILQDSERYIEVIDIFAAVGPLNQPAWSPDGRLLAFNGAIDGDSADLYIYDLTNEVLTRLTSGSTQSLTPYWSPQGTSIVQGGAEVIGWDRSGIGYQMDAMWAISIMNANVKLLFVSEINGYENVLAWPSNTSVLIDTLEAYCPYHDLRTISTNSGEEHLHWANGYDAREYDPASNTILLAVLDVNHPIPECAPTDPAGFYLLDLTTDSVQTLDIDPAADAEIIFDAASERFFIHTGDQLHAIDASGESTQFPAPVRGYQPILISSNGDRWTFVDKDAHLWVGDEAGNLSQVYDGETEVRTWNPQGDALFFLAEEEGAFVLYIAPAPNFMPIKINANFDYPRLGDNLIWSSP